MAAVAQALPAKVTPIRVPVRYPKHVMHVTQPLDPKGFPHRRETRKKDGTLEIKLPGTIENTEYLLAGYGIKVRFNLMSRHIEIDIPGEEIVAEDDAENVAMTQIISLHALNGIAATQVVPYVGALSRKFQFHPVRDWVESKPWDGRSRLQELYETLRVAPEHEDYRNAIMRRWLLSGVAAAFSTDADSRYEGCLILTGAQGLGKTSWLRSLVQPGLGAFRDGLLLDPDNKDSMRIATTAWLVELGEVDATFRKADIAKLKAFLSKPQDIYRDAYARKESVIKRRTFYGATVNDSKFLVDETGNRRWWTIPVLSINWEHDVDRQQVWAELLEIFKTGEGWHLQNNERAMLDRMNSNHEVVRPMEELLRDAFEFDTGATAALPGMARAQETAGRVHMSATALLRVFNLPTDRKNAGEAGSMLRKLTGSEPVGNNGNKGWWLNIKRSSSFAPQLLPLAKR